MTARRAVITMLLFLAMAATAEAGSTLLKSHGSGSGTLSWYNGTTALYDEGDLKIYMTKNAVQYRVQNNQGAWDYIQYTIPNPSNIIPYINPTLKALQWDYIYANSTFLRYEKLPHGIKMVIWGSNTPPSNSFTFNINTGGNITWRNDNGEFYAFDSITGEFLWKVLYPTMKDGDNRDIPLTFSRSGSAITITAPDLYIAGYNFTSWELDPSTQSGDTILIADCHDLVCVSNSIANNTALKTVAAGEWLLNANLHNNNSANTFYINSSNVTWLKINSTSNVVNWFQTNGIVEINNTKITSWNETTSNTVNSGNRGYIYASGSNSKMNISNSNVSYLGYTGAATNNGIAYVSSSSGNNLTNNTLSNNYNGIAFSSSNSNILTNNTITVTSTGYGVSLLTSSNNNITNNTVSVLGGRGVSLTSSSNNNNIHNNIITATTGAGIYLFSSSNNNVIRGGSILSVSGVSYSVVMSNNTFIDTNFTERQIQYNTAGVDWFNYSNTGLIFVSNNVSAAKTIVRNISNWTQSNVTLTDNVTVTSARAEYNITGLAAGTPYNILNNSVLNETLTTDSSGQLPNFSIWLTTTGRTISIDQLPASITNLTCAPNVNNPTTSIDCSWTNPPDADYDHVEKYINGLFQQNTSSPAQAVTIGGLHPDRQYTVSTHTVDIAGNVDYSWVNTTTRTQVADCSDTNRDTNTAFQLLGILLVVGSMGFLVASAWSGQVRGIIIGASGVMVGGIMLTIGYFVVVTVSNVVC